MGVNSLPKTVTRQRRGCDLYPGPSARKPLGYRATLYTQRKVIHGSKPRIRVFKAKARDFCPQDVLKLEDTLRTTSLTDTITQGHSPSQIFYAGGSTADVSCRQRWPPPTTLALTTLLC